MLLLQYSCLQAFGGVAVLHVNRGLCDYRAAVGNFVYEMHGTARNLSAVIYHRFMNFQSVKARAAKGGYKRGVNVDNSVLESLYKAVGNNFKPARKHYIIYAVDI